MAILAPISIAIAGIAGMIYIGHFSVQDLIGLIGVELFGFLSSYYSVYFLIHLDYRRVLITSVLKTAGHAAGFLLFLITGWWYFVYLLGYLLATVYIFAKSSMYEEPLVRTPLFGRVVKDEAFLAASGFCSTLTSYADRLLLYPLVGGAAVSVYYASTIIGKLIFLAASPASGVLLSYLGRKTRLATDSIKTMLVSSLLIGVVLYFISVIISRPIIAVLYPDLVQEAMSLIWITCATSVINSISSIVNPVIIRFCSMAWQLVLSAVSVACYVAISTYLLNLYGLLGFAMGIGLSALITLTLRIIVILSNKSAIAGSELA